MDVELTKDTPDRLNRLLVGGALDIGPISLVEYLRHAEELVLFPDIAVGSEGRCCRWTWSRSARWPNSRQAGRARVHLAHLGAAGRLWLHEVHRVEPEYFSCPPDLTAMMLEADAAVVIGDVALRATYEGASKGLEVHDLGQAWRSWTGLPMVFAVWAVRRTFAAEETPGLVKDVHAAFVSSRDEALAHVDQVAAQASRWEFFDAPTLANYFQTLDFSSASASWPA